MNSDEKWMRRALALAAKGRGWVHPNPMVGAVLVRNGRIVGEGYHRRFGGPHAEIEALRQAGARAKGATLYVTLEPCSHWGKTPPCAEAVAKSGVRRVVAAMRDPNPLVAGKGFSFLKKRGIRIASGVLEDEARELNKAFIIWVTKKRPFVTLKVAASLDGRTSTVTGESKWITGEASRSSGHRLRAIVDAIAVGANTIRKDNPRLSAHGKGRDPIRIVFQGRRPISRKANVFKGEAGTWILKAGRNGIVDLPKALKDLARRGIAHLLVEGGRALQESFLKAGVVDEVVWFLAPMILGNAKRLKDAIRLSSYELRLLNGDLCLQASLKPSGK